MIDEEKAAQEAAQFDVAIVKLKDHVANLRRINPKRTWEEIYQIYTDMTQEEFRTAAEKVIQEQKEKIL